MSSDFNNPFLKINNSIKDFYATLNDTKEEIIKAFIAQYGCMPDECVLIEQTFDTGRKYWVQKRENNAEIVPLIVEECHYAIEFFRKYFKRIPNKNGDLISDQEIEASLNHILRRIEYFYKMIDEKNEKLIGNTKESPDATC